MAIHAVIGAAAARVAASVAARAGTSAVAAAGGKAAATGGAATATGGAAATAARASASGGAGRVASTMQGRRAAMGQRGTTFEVGKVLDSLSRGAGRAAAWADANPQQVQRLRAAGSEFATDSFFSKNDAAQARTVAYTPFPASRVAFERFEQASPAKQGGKQGSTNPAETKAPDTGEGGAVTAPVESAPTPPPYQGPAVSAREIAPGARDVGGYLDSMSRWGQVPPYRGPEVPPQPNLSAALGNRTRRPKAQTSQTTEVAPGTFATPDSAVYSQPPAGPYVQGTGNPFSRRPDWPRTANPFDGQQSTGRPVAVNPNVVNPFGRPRVNPFADAPQVIGRTAPASDRMPGPVPSNEVYNSRSRGGNLSSIRNVLGDAAEVMNRPKPPQR